MKPVAARLPLLLAVFLFPIFPPDRPLPVQVKGDPVEAVENTISAEEDDDGATVCVGVGADGHPVNECASVTWCLSLGDMAGPEVGACPNIW